jgi:GalNAc-alpha-(1->4)-GalNAc-alpha-(1->3)-diNAcBac-PP-undecaprenol alpha-1,4-N-acetyl-D-galactosaminyltransferase
MKLLFVVKSLVLPGGGAERVLAQVSGGLVRRGHDVAVASFDHPGQPSFYALDPAVRWQPLGVGQVRTGTGIGEALGRIAALRRTVRQAGPDAAIGFMHSAYIPLGLALLGSGVPMLASEHIAYEHYRTRPLQAALLRLAPRLARAITIISPEIRSGFPPSLRRRMVVLPNPVGASGGRPADPCGGDRPFRTLLAVGRLEAQKDHATLIRAFAALADRCPDWRLRIVGEGSLRGALERQVRELGLEGWVSLPGATADIEREYEAAQLFVMSSTYESFGLTTAEALGHGLPVIGFADCPGTNELVRDRVNGLLVDGADRAAALAAGLAELMGSGELRRRYGAAGPGSIQAFAPERIVGLWEKLLADIAAGRREEG